MNYEVDYDHINSLCPDNCQAAFDGLKLMFNYLKLFSSFNISQGKSNCFDSL